MADFRKFIVLAGLVLMLALTASAQSQPGPFTCTANAAVPPTLRAEGMTELVGDIVLDCQGGVPTLNGINIPLVNFTIYLNTNVTSRLLTQTTANANYSYVNNLSEAMLIVDEPTTNQSGATQFLICPSSTGCSITGTAATNAQGITLAGSEPYSGSGNRYNVFLGLVTGNQVQFLGVPVDPPGTTGPRVFRFTNIRANASQISAGSSGTPGSIQALISATGSTSVPITSPTQVVGFVQSGLTFGYLQRGDLTAANQTSNVQFPQCNSLNPLSTSFHTTASFVLRYTENFPTSFKTQGSTNQITPGAIYNTESGFTLGYANTSQNGSGLVVNSTLGYASSGTLLKATFANIPTGVTIYASLNSYTASGSGLSAYLRSSEQSPAAGLTYTDTAFVTPAGLTATVANGGVAASSTSPAAQLPVVNGSATAVWEVTGTNSLSSDNYYFVVWFRYGANAATNTPAPGTTTVTAGFAPTPTGLGVTASVAAQASLTLPYPRFTDSSTSRAAFIIYICRTNLLFPFVTNQAGFDTGLAIANTSLDSGVFSSTTAPQQGACTLFPFGDNAPASQSTGTVAAGKVWANNASVLMPNFQGYVIAQCAFQYAHGFAFVSDLGARNLAMGYLALIIPEPGLGGRGANPLSASGTGSGEQIAH